MRLKSEDCLQKPAAFHSSVVGATRHAPYQMNMESIFNFADTLVSKSEAEDHTRRGWLSLASFCAQSEPRRCNQTHTCMLACKTRKKQQATQRTWGMPRREKPKKDAETGETFRGSCMQAMSPENPNGVTHPE